ncbi:MAG: TolC family protein [Pseudomonadota bacterium]|nr:TolC family protein [Pseudomonadota bacterium]
MIIKYLGVVTLLLASIQAHTEEQALQKYLEKLEEHPQVTQILEQSYKLKELSISEMGLPDPQLILGVDNVPVNSPKFDRFLPTSKTIGFKQQIPSYSLRKAKAGKQVMLSKRQQLMAEYTQKRLKAILLSELSELDKVKKLEKLAKKQLGYYKLMEDDLKGQLEAGQPVYGRFSEIDVERTEIEQYLNGLKAERVSIEEELIFLVGEVPHLELPALPDVAWHREQASLYPVAIASESVNAASKGTDAALAAFKPNYGIQALYKQRESGSTYSGDDWFSVQATVSIPLWYKKNQKPKLRAAQAEKRSAEFAYDETARYWVKRMSELKAEREVAQDNIALLKGKRASLQEMVEAANRNYESGNAPLESVLDAQIDELTIASQLAKQRSRYARLSAEFNSHIIERSYNENN